MRTAIIFLLAVGAVLGAVEALPGQAPDHTGAATVKALGRLPLYFVENRGVYPDEVRYYIQGADKTLFFTDSGVTIALKGKERGWAVKLDFVGARICARPVGLEKQQAVFSYFTGAEKEWKAGLPTFAKLVYCDLWPGVDLVYNGTVNKLKYEFVVAPGADPKQIRLQYRGTTSVSATDAGALRVATPEGSFEDAPPVAWQEIDGERVPVAMAYAADDDGRFGFSVGEYDRAKPLVLDPAVIVYCGYVGGAQTDNCFGVDVDSKGNVYLCGSTQSDHRSFPVTAGSFDPTYNGTIAKYPTDAWVAKIDPTGTKLLYCGYIGGDELDQALDIEVDSVGCAYVCGATRSTQKTFPVKVGPIRQRPSTVTGISDAFVAKIDSAGKSLVYCGYIGGTDNDGAYGLALDVHGAVYVAGTTKSTNLPVTTGAFGPKYGGNGDGFVAKVLPGGTGIAYCSYFGGAGQENWGNFVAIAVDGKGQAHVAGWTNSDQKSFPVTAGAYDTTFNGGPGDAIVAKIDATGKRLVFCTYLGGSGQEGMPFGFGIAVDQSGIVHVASSTASKDFPVTGGPKFAGGWDIFLAKFDATGSRLLSSRYFGGSAGDECWGMALDRRGWTCIAGMTSSTDLPVRGGPALKYRGAVDAFVAKFDSSGTMVNCGYLGGTNYEECRDIAVDAAGDIYLVGSTWSTETQGFPVRAGPDPTHNGGTRDAFVAKIAYQDNLTASGTPRPGSTVSLNLAAIQASGLPYQLGTSFGTGPIKVDRRTIGLSVDGLLEISVGGKWPHVFQGYTGVLDSQGKATAKIVIPSISALVGQKLYSAFVTLDPSWPSGIRSISETRVITIV